MKILFLSIFFFFLFPYTFAWPPTDCDSLVSSVLKTSSTRQNIDQEHFTQESLSDLFLELQEAIYVNKITLEDRQMRTVIYQWDTRNKNPSIVIMVNIGRFFGVNISFLLEHVGRLKDQIDLSKVNKERFLSQEERNLVLKTIHQQLLGHIDSALQKDRLTKEDLASRLNIPRELLRKISEERGVPRLLTLVNILEKLDIDVILFFKQIEIVWHSGGQSKTIDLTRETSLIQKQRQRKTIPVDLKKQLLTLNGDIREEYKGMVGYAKFAEDHYEGKMQVTFQNTSAVLEKSVFQKTNWQSFQGTVEDFRELKGKLLTLNGDIREEYKGMVGYAKFAEDHYEGKMQVTFQNTSAVLEKSVFQTSGWRQFKRNVKDFRKLKGKLLTSNGDIREEYKGMVGYAKFAEDHYEGKMQVTFKNTSAVLEKSVFQKTNWQSFQGTVEDFRELKGKLLTLNGDIRKEYKGMVGYAKFAEDHYEGKMQVTFQNTSAVLEKSVFQTSGWRQFQRNVKDFRELKGKLLTLNGDIRKEYKGMVGYAKFAEDHYEGKMQVTFQNTSAVLEKSVFQKTNWQSFQGTVEDFRELKGKLLTLNGDIREEYKGMVGYAKFAEDHYEGNMLKAFHNTSAVLEKSVFQTSGWRQFRRNVKDFRELKGKLLTLNGDIRDEYKGMVGYAKFAEDHYEGKMKTTFQNTSAVLEKSVFQKTNWQSFQGTVEDFRKLK